MLYRKIKLLLVFFFVLKGNFVFAEQPSNTFRVDNIFVEEKTGDLIDSKNIAMLRGSRKALSTLLLNLNADSRKEAVMNCLNNVKDTELFVADYFVRSEKMTSQSYSGSVDFIFKQQEVENLMNTCNLSYTSVSPGVVLLVPLLYLRGDYDIVDNEEDPDFFNVIDELKDNFGLLSIKKVFSGDQLHMAEIDTNLVAKGDYKQLAEVLNYYNCSSLLVMILKSKTPHSLMFEVKMLTLNEEYHDTLTYKAYSGESSYHFMKRATEEVLRTVDAVWKGGFKSDKKSLFNSGLVVEMSTVNDWNIISSKLNQIDGIKQYKFKTISNHQIDLELKYILSPEQLSDQLLKKGVAIFKKGDKTIMKLIQKQ